MKKILMGTLGMAMAASSFAGVYEHEHTVNVPVQARVILGEMTTTTSIKVTGDLSFGDLKPSLELGGNNDSTATKKDLKVYKVENGTETPLNVGEFGYKPISQAPGWSWDAAVAGGWVVEDGEVQVTQDVFHENGTGPNVSIGDADHNGFPYALRTQAKDGGIDVWFSGDVNSSLRGKTYEAKVDIYVALPEAYKK